MRAIRFTLCLFLFSQPALAQQGLRAEYFKNIELTGRAYERIESKPYLNHKLKSPAPGIPQEYYSVRWTGKVHIPVTGEYKFLIRADDGVRLWIDHQLLIDQWHEQEATTFEANIFLTGEMLHDIRIEYFNTILHSVMLLSWENPADEYTFMGFKTLRPQVEIPLSYFRVTAPPPSERPSIAAITTRRPTQEKPQLTRSDESDEASPYENEKPIVLSAVEFEQGKSELRPTSFQELDKLADHLRRHPKLRIDITGHTDYAGDSTANHLLSHDRAEAVATYLQTKGIDKSRITVIAMGSRAPLIFRENIYDRQRNRRVEFTLHKSSE